VIDQDLMGRDDCGHYGDVAGWYALRPPKDEDRSNNRHMTAIVAPGSFVPPSAG
jgi:hypothetical protein